MYKEARCGGIIKVSLLSQNWGYKKNGHSQYIVCWPQIIILIWIVDFGYAYTIRIPSFEYSIALTNMQ